MAAVALTSWVWAVVLHTNTAGFIRKINKTQLTAGYLHQTIKNGHLGFGWTSPSSWLSSSRLLYRSDMDWTATYTRLRSDTSLSAMLSSVPWKPLKRETDWPISSLQMPGTAELEPVEWVEGGLTAPINPGTDTSEERGWPYAAVTQWLLYLRLQLQSCLTYAITQISGTIKLTSRLHGAAVEALNWMDPDFIQTPRNSPTLQQASAPGGDIITIINSPDQLYIPLWSCSYFIVKSSLLLRVVKNHDVCRLLPY